MKWLWGLFWLMTLCGEVAGAEKVVNVVNPVRPRSLWIDKSIKPIMDQYEIVANSGVKATWLIQDEALLDEELMAYIKSMNIRQEYGVLLEITKDLAYRSRVYFEEERPWYDPGVVFLSGYVRDDRRKLIDKVMEDFRLGFGYYPKAVGAWWIDSYSLSYLEDRYGIRVALICADQMTTDNYGIWGQWWGYPYYPAKENILSPGDSKVLIIQWALRDPALAFDGEGWRVSNHSLQANDYKSLGYDTEYFKKLAMVYFDQRNKLGQITVGLETGIESVHFISEYKKQIEWLVTNKIEDLTMTEMSDRYYKVYGGNPERIYIGEWLMTPDYRENNKLGERTDYMDNMVFTDYYDSDTSGFLNRIYRPDNMRRMMVISPDWIALGVLSVLGAIVTLLVGTKYGMAKMWVIVALCWIITWTIGHVRYSVIDGQSVIGVLSDKLRFVGINLSGRWMNLDMTNVVAKSMLKFPHDVGWLTYIVCGGLAVCGGRLMSGLMSKVQVRWLIVVVLVGILAYFNRWIFEYKFEPDYWENYYYTSQWNVPNSHRVISDEGVYRYIGFRLVNGENPFNVDYWVPPLGKYWYGVGAKYLNNPYWISFIVYILSVLAVGMISRSVLTTSLWAMNPLIVEQIGQTMLDLPMTMLFLFHLYFIFEFRKDRSIKLLMMAAIFLGLMAGTKPPYFVPMIGLVDWWWIGSVDRNMVWKKRLGYLLGVIGGYILSYVCYFWEHPNPIPWIRLHEKVIAFQSNNGGSHDVLNIFKTILLNRYHGFWVGGGIIPMTGWSSLLPIGTIVLLKKTVTIWRLINNNRKEKAYLVLVGLGYILMNLSIDFWPRYLVFLVSILVLLIGPKLKHGPILLAIIIFGYMPWLKNTIAPDRSRTETVWLEEIDDQHYREAYRLLSKDSIRAISEDGFLNLNKEGLKWNLVKENNQWRINLVEPYNINE